MRLIKATTLEIEEFLSEDKVPPFAILSHTWEEDECTLQQMQNAETNMVTKRKGYQKIRQCCEQALEDGLQWAWVDTYACCIDKTSTAELSEAINSMFRWYRKAKVCYAFISDVITVNSLPKSRWFTRGWTLQELVAPRDVRFYNSGWHFLGSKLDLRQVIHSITTIEEEVLVTGNFETINIARRMAWAAARQTTRIEDRAYSLMGIFDVNMPLLYGEGHKAFVRLQEAIMKVSDDQSLFAWGLPELIKTWEEYLHNFATPDTEDMRGIFAASPADFTFSDRIHVLQDNQSTVPPIMASNGVRIELQVHGPEQACLRFAVLYCTMHGSYHSYLGIPIIQWDSRWLTRCGELVTIAVSDLVEPQSELPHKKPEILLLRAPVGRPGILKSIDTITFAQNSHKYTTEVHCATHAAYSPATGVITLSQDIDTLHAIIVFSGGPEQLFPLPAGSRLLYQKHTKISLVRRYQYYSEINHVTAISPSFAVLVGRRAGRLWVNIVILLDDDDRDEQFQQLLKADAEFIRECATKQAVLSKLEEKMDANVLGVESEQTKMVMLWYESHASDTSYTSRRENQKRVLVNVRMGDTSKNLAEHGPGLFVTISSEGEEPRVNVPKTLQWWK
ncbi:hypothetical protein DE146DRAFT_607355 [Phaeosphaeria sp. MPI-PUGE-AT-0046c]|nr:hypothetical protein DE146DRAFT_607355 [Phaeosphaeria sp. MPI-PUGE-AT-0046c]